MRSFLGRAEQMLGHYFKVSFGYILRGGGWLALDQGVGAVLSIVITVAFANLVSPETYGTYRYLMVVFGILTVFTLPSMNLALTTSVAKGYEGLLGRALESRIRWGFLGGVGALLVALYHLVSSGDAGVVRGLILVAIAVPFQDSLNIWSGFLRGRQLFRENAIYTIITRLSSALSVLCVLVLHPTLTAILIAYFLPYIIARILILKRVERSFQPNDCRDESLLSYGRHLSFIQFFNVAVNSLDGILIFNMLGPASLALYNVASVPVAKLQQFFSLLGELALPRFSATRKSVVTRSLVARMLKLMIFVVVIMGSYVAVAPLLFKIVFPRYIGAVGYSEWLALTLLAFPFSFIYTFFQAHALKWEITVYNTVIRVAQLCLTVFLVPRYGITGAVAGRILFQGISLVTLFALFLPLRDHGEAP
jgi:O-antigen/teichoic acid export membrane protein